MTQNLKKLSDTFIKMKQNYPRLIEEMKWTPPWVPAYHGSFYDLLAQAWDTTWLCFYCYHCLSRPYERTKMAEKVGIKLHLSTTIHFPTAIRDARFD